MAQIFTTPEGPIQAKVWFHDVAFAGGISTTNLRSDPPSFAVSQWAPAECKIICDELVNRDFANIDSSIRKLAPYSFITSYDFFGTRKRFKPEAVAKALVYMSEQLGLYWDDTIKTPYEIEEFKKTLLGTMVYKYNRYLSSIKDKKAKSSSSSSSSTNSSVAGGKSPATTSSYKQSGPQSGNVRALRGIPGQKVTADNNIIYKIIGDNPTSKNTPNAFVKPLSASGRAVNLNKVFVSSGNGYTDCTCFFDDPNNAADFLDKLIKNSKDISASITNLRVVKLKADPNGYFIVGTEYGDCAISAKALNEALDKNIEEAIDEPSSWSKATEGYSQEEIEELHTWMRKD